MWAPSFILPAPPYFFTQNTADSMHFLLTLWFPLTLTYLLTYLHFPSAPNLPFSSFPSSHGRITHLLSFLNLSHPHSLCFSNKATAYLHLNLIPPSGLSVPCVVCLHPNTSFKQALQLGNWHIHNRNKQGGKAQKTLNWGQCRRSAHDVSPLNGLKTWWCFGFNLFLHRTQLYRCWFYL